MSQQRAIARLVDHIIRDRIDGDPKWQPVEDHVLDLVQVANSIIVYALSIIPDRELREFVAEQIEDHVPALAAAASRRHDRLNGDSPPSIGVLH